MNPTRILVVEDEAIVAADLSSKLEQLGYAVAGIAARGEEAVAMAARHKPHLVLMDIQLEGELDGIEAAEAIRRERDLPVIYLTAHSDAATLSRAKITSPFGYIIKPFEERDLATRIELAVHKHAADRAVREQREWLRVTLTSIGDAVMATDAGGLVAFLNPAAEALTGWKAEEAIGRSISDIFQVVEKTTGTAAEDPVASVLREGVVLPWSDHTELVSRGGGRIPIEERVSPMRDDSGNVIGTVLVFRDITEKIRARDALDHSRFMLAEAEKLSRTGAWEWDLLQDRWTFSEAWRDIHGVPPRTLTADEMLAIAHPEDRPAVAAAMAAAQRGEAAYDLEHRIVRMEDREVRTVRARGRYVRDREGRVIRVYGFARDITERKKAEEEIRRSHRELEQFSYAASHDLQEPLRSMMGFLQLLQRHLGEAVDEKGRGYIERALAAGNRMQTLIRDLLSLSRVTTAQAAFATTDLNALVQSVLATLEPVLQASRAVVRCGELPTLTVEASQVQSLFQNLITNGVKYNRSPRPTVDIGCRRNGNAYRFSVADNGIGIDPRHQERIFMVFQRLHTEREYPGTGIGLALCKRIVERHGGRIWVESQPGQGAVFHFTLPGSGLG